jgi:CheY-like chemotaxis protein
MVYGFVCQSGGHVTLYSELGLGTSFGLYFPALPQSTVQSGTDAPNGRASVLPQGNGETILIVEDNPKVRKLSSERIRDLGFQALEAESGDQAYQMLKAGAQVDLVFSDLVMPGALNGSDLAAKVSQEFPQLKVFLTSGYASNVITLGLAHERPYEILHKPYRQSEMARRLQALLHDVFDA